MTTSVSYFHPLKCDHTLLAAQIMAHYLSIFGSCNTQMPTRRERKWPRALELQISAWSRHSVSGKLLLRSSRRPSIATASKARCCVLFEMLQCLPTLKNNKDSVEMSKKSPRCLGRCLIPLQVHQVKLQEVRSSSNCSEIIVTTYYRCVIIVILDAEIMLLPDKSKTNNLSVGVTEDTLSQQ